MAEAYNRSVQLLRDEFGLKDDISVSLIARFPDVLRVEKPEEDEEKIWSLLSVALNDALDALINMRQIEGEGLMHDLLERTTIIENNIKEISIRAPEVDKEY